MKEVILRYAGNDSEIDFAIETLAKRAGWKQLTQQEIEAGVVQKTKESAALDYVTEFIRQSVKQEILKQVTSEIERQAAEAKAASIAQTTGGLDLIKKSLEIIKIE
jgi:hypothetical protein